MRPDEYLCMTPNELIMCIKARRKSNAVRTHDLAELIGQKFAIVYNNAWNKKKIESPSIYEIFPWLEELYLTDEQIEEKERIKQEQEKNAERNRAILTQYFATQTHKN